MRIPLVFAVLLSLAHAATPSDPLPFSYIVDGERRREVRDPCMVQEGGRYYLVFTMWPFANREEDRLGLPHQGGSPGIELYSSADLETWKSEGWLVKSADLPEDCPYKNRFWAPEIHKIRGRFYLVFTADNWIRPEFNPAGNWGTAGHAFVGVADRITGPYEHITWIPEGACDTTLFEADDGRTFAVMPKHDLFLRQIDLSRLREGTVRWLGEEKRIVECGGGAARSESPEYLEGPWVTRIGGKLVLFFAENYGDRGGYWTGAAVADSPAGPWQEQRKAFFGGHLSTFEDPLGRHGFAYRIEDPGEQRGLLAIEPFVLDSVGRVEAAGPSIPSKVPSPEAR